MEPKDYTNRLEIEANDFNTLGIILDNYPKHKIVIAEDDVIYDGDRNHVMDQRPIGFSMYLGACGETLGFDSSLPLFVQAEGNKYNFYIECVSPEAWMLRLHYVKQNEQFIMSFGRHGENPIDLERDKNVEEFFLACKDMLIYEGKRPYQAFKRLN